MAAGSTKDDGKLIDARLASHGKALSDTPALKPYWRKPAVRNFREGNGNVGIIRSPLRAIALPDKSLSIPGTSHARNPSAIVLMMPVTMHLPAGSLSCDGKDRIVAFRLRRIVSPSLFALIVFASSASCGRKSEAKYPPHFPFAYVQRDCGPADGPALAFYFTLKQSPLGKYEEPFLMISINENLPSSAPQSYWIKSGKYAVLASRCLSPGQCDAATSGTLHLTTFSPGKGATGEYELHFQDGRVERDSFNAAWHVAKHLMCG